MSQFSLHQTSKEEFKLAEDASDIGAGNVLLQEGDNGEDHTVCYFSKMFNKHEKNYSSLEKECSSHILAIQHFEVYLTSSSTPITLVNVYVDLLVFTRIAGTSQTGSGRYWC